MIMRAFVFRSRNDFGVQNVPVPALPGPQWVRVRVKACGVCGTDLQRFRATRPRAPRPHIEIFGHEISGVVAECGRAVSKYVVGDRVVIDPLLRAPVSSHNRHVSELSAIGRNLPGGFAEYLVVRQDQLAHLPAGMPHELAVLADPLAVAIHAVALTLRSRRTQVTPIAVVGDGCLGLLLTAVCAARGLPVVVYGHHTERAALAKAIGATAFIVADSTPHAEMPPRGFAAVFEAVGGKRATPLGLCLRLTEPGGSLCVLGVYDPRVVANLHLHDLFRREIRMFGANGHLGGPGKRRDIQSALDLLARDPAKFGPIVTNVVSLSTFSRTLRPSVRAAGPSPIKMVIAP